MTIRYKTFATLILLIYIYSNNSQYDIIPFDNDFSIRLVEIIKYISPLYTTIIVGVLLLMHIRFGKLKVTTFIIECLIICIAVTLTINKLMLSETINMIIFNVNYTLSTQDKLIFLTNYFNQLASYYYNLLEDSDKHAFEIELDYAASTINVENIKLMSTKEIEAYCDQLVSKVLENTLNRYYLPQLLLIALALSIGLYLLIQ